METTAAAAAAPTNNKRKITNDTVGHIGGAPDEMVGRCMEIIMSAVWVNAVASHHTSQIDCRQTFAAIPSVRRTEGK